MIDQFYEADGYSVDLPKGDFAFKGKMLICNVIHPRTQSHFTTLITFLHYSCFLQLSLAG